eukprot:scaffold1767_cov131-Skeletonema_menzelii.AAC.5
MASHRSLCPVAYRFASKIPEYLLFAESEKCPPTLPDVALLGTYESRVGISMYMACGLESSVGSGCPTSLGLECSSCLEFLPVGKFHQDSARISDFHHLSAATQRAIGRVTSADYFLYGNCRINGH